MSDPEVPQVSGLKTDKLYEYALAVAIGEIGEYVYCLQNGKFYVYDNGYWQEILETKFLSIIQERLIRSIRVKVQDNWIEQKGKILTRYTPARKRQIIDHFKLIKYKELHEFNLLPLLNLDNYMLNPLTHDVINHAPDYYSTIRIPYKYERLATCGLWIKTLNEIFEKDKIKIDTLQEFFGQCLTKDIKQEKALLLLGESRSGKSTISNTLQHIIGNDNCSFVPLKYFTNPQYTSMMVSKLVNFDKDVSRKAVDFEEDFKKIVTGEEISCNDKYVAPFRFNPYCKVVLSANIFPRITDYSSAFYNRLILIPCDRVFSPDEQNRNLREELLLERPGILNWAIEGLKRLIKRGRFEEVNFMKEAVEELENENNPGNLFMDEHIEVDFTTYVEKAFLFDKYKEWCLKNGQYAVTNVVFSKNIYKRFHKETSKKGRSAHGTRPLIWPNLRYIDNQSMRTQKIPLDWQE